MADDPHYISLKDAVDITTRWRENMPQGGYKGGMFQRIAFDNLLAQPGCAGIRIYMAMFPEGARDPKQYPSRWAYVMVGTDAKGNDIVGGSTAMADGQGDMAEGLIEELSLLCPPFCDTSSPLNGGSLPAQPVPK